MFLQAFVNYAPDQIKSAYLHIQCI